MSLLFQFIILTIIILRNDSELSSMWLNYFLNFLICCLDNYPLPISNSSQISNKRTQEIMKEYDHSSVSAVLFFQVSGNCPATKRNLKSSKQNDAFSPLKEVKRAGLPFVLPPCLFSFPKTIKYVGTAVYVY